MTTLAPKHTETARRREADVSPPRRRVRPRALDGWLWLLPALVFYGFFVVYPLTQTVRYSFYDWNGIGTATWVGFTNYERVLADPQLYGSVIHAVQLIFFFTVLPVVWGLAAASVLRGSPGGRFAAVARTVLFLPQIIPLAGAATAWIWIYSRDGLINQVLGLLGGEALARAWLGDFTTALPAVGLIGTWVASGFCTVLFLSGISRIDSSLYEAAKLDGAGRLQEFWAVTLPGLRRQIVVAVTITVIGALASFDIVYMATQGGPGNRTMVPGVQVVRLAFTERAVGLASALSVVLLLLVLLVVLAIQRFDKDDD